MVVTLLWLQYYIYFFYCSVVTVPQHIHPLYRKGAYMFVPTGCSVPFLCMSRYNYYKTYNTNMLKYSTRTVTLPVTHNVLPCVSCYVHSSKNTFLRYIHTVYFMHCKHLYVYIYVYVYIHVHTYAYCYQ